jgi:hypothetical protein
MMRRQGNGEALDDARAGFAEEGEELRVRRLDPLGRREIFPGQRTSEAKTEYPLPATPSI